MFGRGRSQKRETDRLTRDARSLAERGDMAMSQRLGRDDPRVLALRQEMSDYLAHATPLIITVPVAALCVIDVARPAIQLGTVAEDWETVARCGAALASAMLKIRPPERFDDALEREIGRFYGRFLDQGLYALAQVDEYPQLGSMCDFLLGGGVAGRNFMQTAEPAVRRAWDISTGVFLNGGATMSDHRWAAKLEEGAWLTPRQHAKPGEYTEVLSIALDWMADADALLQTVPKLEMLAGQTSQEAWSRILAALTHAYQLAPTWWPLFATAAGCATPMAAHQSGRDVVYAIAGATGGVAVRFHGAERFRQHPDRMTLPDGGLANANELGHMLDELAKIPAGDLPGRSAVLDDVRLRVGRAFLEPMLAQWPDLREIILIPVGPLRRLPFLTAFVNGARANSVLDMTLAPNTTSVLAAVATGATRAGGQPVAVLADPGPGDAHLPWVGPEATEVAAVYHREVDLVVDHGPVSGGGPRERAISRSVDTYTGTSEHVLTLLENARVVHLACHGHLPEDEGLPTLFLGGIIPLGALEHHRFADGTTVVLSACSVGSSIRAVPFSPLGFPALLLASGAAEVIASTEPLIDCEHTVAFMVLLHERLRQGLSGADALASAMSAAEGAGMSSAVWGSIHVQGARTGSGRATPSIQLTPADGATNEHP